MKILKYRMIAEVYPFLSLEAMVQLADGTIVYTNIDTNGDGEQMSIEDCDYFHWTYTHALTDMDLENHDIADYQYDLTKEEDKFVIEKLVELWNSNPIFDNDATWKDYSSECSDCSKR